MFESIFMKTGMYIMATEPISVSYFINPSHQSVCLYVHPYIVARQRLSIQVSAAMNIDNKRRNVGSIFLYAIRVLSNSSLWVFMCIPLSLQSNGSVKTFPRQRRIVGGVLFYAVRFVSKESRRWILPRTYFQRFCSVYWGRNILIQCDMTPESRSGPSLDGASLSNGPLTHAV
jgi:hypothetical protein